MGTREELVNVVREDDDEVEVEEEIDFEVADALSKNILEGLERKEVSATNGSAALVLAAATLLFEDGLDDHDIYATVVSLVGLALRAPEDEEEEE